MTVLELYKKNTSQKSSKICFKILIGSTNDRHGQIRLHLVKHSIPGVGRENGSGAPQPDRVDVWKAL